MLAIAGKLLIEAISQIGKYLKVKEFVLAFFIVALGTTLPNLVIGIISAINDIPELSFGDVIGGNIFDLTIVMGLSAILSRGGLSANSRTVQGSSFYTIIVAILPLLLIFDGTLSRIDGILLLISFGIYTAWLFSKKDRFSKTYDDCEGKVTFTRFLGDFLEIIGGLALLMAGGYGIVKSAEFFNNELNLSLALIGLFVVSIGNCIPETIFSIHAARSGQDWMIFGNQMGNVAFSSTFILGVVSLVHPIQIADFHPFAVARIFLVISVIAFFIFLKTHQKISKKEGVGLICIYFIFLISVILTK
jgi:cation:H+ antiporter